MKESAAKGTHEAVLRLMKKEVRKGIVLDAAAGEGALTYNLKKEHFDVIPCDICPENFKIEDIWCYKADLNKKIPFNDKTFTYVTSVETIEHLENPWYFLREISRVLKDDGTLILTTPNINSISSRALFFYNLNYHDFGEYTYHVSPINFTMIKKMLTDAGFKIEILTTNKFIRPKASFLFHLFYPFLKPKNKVILLGDILILKCKKFI